MNYNGKYLCKPDLRCLKSRRPACQVEHNAKQNSLLTFKYMYILFFYLSKRNRQGGESEKEILFVFPNSVR